MSSKLEGVLESINKQYGKGTAFKMDEDSRIDISTISSGSLAFDMALGGGYAEGRVVEIYGAESSGKSTLALTHIAERQKIGHICAYIDMEQAVDVAYAETLGVNMSELIFSQPDYGEQAMDIVEKLIKSEEVRCIVIDSVATLIPKAELDGEIGDNKMGLHARLMSQVLRKLTPISNKNKCTLIFLNQTREKIGVMFGNPTTTTGGNALKFYASQRIETSKRKAETDRDGVAISTPVTLKVIKNKVAPPFKKAEISIIYKEGIDKVGEIVDLGVELEILEKSGSWFSYGETKIGQGKEKVRDMLLDNPELYEEILEKVKEKIGL